MSPALSSPPGLLGKGSPREVASLGSLRSCDICRCSACCKAPQRRCRSCLPLLLCPGCSCRLQLSLTSCFTTQQFPFFTLSQTDSSLGIDPACCRMCPRPLCFYQTPRCKADAGGAGPTSDLGSRCLPLPGPCCSADIRYCRLRSGLLKGRFPPLVCSNLGLRWDESASSLGVDPAGAHGRGLDASARGRAAWQRPQLGMLLVLPGESFKPCGKRGGSNSAPFGRV